MHVYRNYQINSKMHINLQEDKNGQDNLEGEKLSWMIYTTRYINLF